MFLLIDTSTPVCKLILSDGKNQTEFDWQADRELAKKLLEKTVEFLQQHNLKLDQLDGIGIFRGPGSFTGLRISATTFNAVAEFADVKIVGETGDDWQEKALMRLKNGENDQIVLPEYGRPARITKPRK